MSPLGSKKRSRETRPQSSRTRKRARHGVSLALDNLDWKSVSMPDRLDDVEGFYGLEEVSDVEIVGLGGGKVEYRVSDKSTAPTKKTADNGDDGGNGDESEWGGIADTDTEEAQARTKELKAAKDKKSKLKEKQREKQREKKKKAKQSKSSASDAAANPFDLLADDDTGDVELPEWDSLNLSLPVLKALSKLTFRSPTRIQAEAIPKIMAGHDLIGKASTGSGKTLAFGIPILEAFLARQPAVGINADDVLGDQKTHAEKDPIALILAPTRELAHQLHAHLTALAAFAPDCNIVTLTGGMSSQKQLRQLAERGGADIIIATPGRLWEIISEGQGWIDKLRQGLQFLVVDEADRLLQEGHFKEAEEVLNLISNTVAGEEGETGEQPEAGSDDDDDVLQAKADRRTRPKKSRPNRSRQTLVFSATFHQGLQQKLATKGKKAWSVSGGGDLMSEEESMKYLLKKLCFREEKPQFVDVNPVRQLAEQLREGIIECGPMEKDLYLYYLLLRYPCRTLVFTNSISSVKRLSPFLTELQLPASPLHSSMIQKARLRSLERFSAQDKTNSILVATDVAARGLDIKGVEMVIHYHLPRSADMYVHRSGRTARADARGISVLLCAPEEVTGVRRLVGKVHEGGSASRYTMKSFDVDRKLATRLKRRVELAKKITDSGLEKQRKGHEDEWMKTAAEELGVDLDDDEFQSTAAKGRGLRGQKKREQAASATKADVGAWKAELKQLLQQKINSGFSERYLTAGSLNLAQALLEREDMHEQILGLEKRNVVDEIAS